MRAVPYGESDLIVGFFTEGLGRVSALARRARGSKRLHLEPMHTLDLTLRGRSVGGLLSVSTATIVVPRAKLLLSLERMEAAGTALRWVRQAVPASTPEPGVWDILQHLLEALDQPTVASPRSLVVVAGLQLLEALGYALDLNQCVSCGRPCPEDRSAYVDAARGGLVCRRCGGSGVVLQGPLRARLRRASQGMAVLFDEDLSLALELVELGLLAHANVKN